MKEITKQNQNYLFLQASFLCLWFEKMRQQQALMYPVKNKFLPSPVENKDSLPVDFSAWNVPQPKTTLMVEEYLWGVRCGLSQFLDIDNCSLSAVLNIAKTDDMCEIYSPAKVQYYSDGSRKVISHEVSAYNTAAKFSCYSLINIDQAKNLFPQYSDSFDVLPSKTLFLCSPDGTKLRIASQEKGEIAFNFNYADCRQDISFYLGHLRATFEYIAQEIAQGRGNAFCQPDKMNDVDYLYNQVVLMAGGKFAYEKAMSLATENDAEIIRKRYIQEGIKGKTDFTVLINGAFLEDDSCCNNYLNRKETDSLKLCVAPSVYQSWGKPFTKDELKLIYSPRTFNFDADAEKDCFCKANRLRFKEHQIGIYRKNEKNPIIEVETLEELIEKQLKENSIEKFIEEAERLAYAARDLSGPSRSSIYTNF